MKRLFCVITALVLISVQTLFAQSTSGQKPNIIFLVADDLNDFPGFMEGHPQVSTPNLDRIAREGYVFENAYCNAPVCAASRFSFMTGKDPSYTGMYNNNLINPTARIFRNTFRPEFGNETVFTIPEILKDSGGYYTLGINKLFHGYTSKGHNNDFDTATLDPCSRALSWNQFYDWDPSLDPVIPGLPDFGEGAPGNPYGALDNSQEADMLDTKATDSAVTFLNNYAADPAQFCNRPFFLAVGSRRPHGPWFVPEKYFLPDYKSVIDLYDVPYDYPFNEPREAWPPNGVILQPQPPEGRGADLYALPDIAQEFAVIPNLDEGFDFFPFLLPSIPVVDPAFTDSQRVEIIATAKRAGKLMAYLASIRYYDAQVGRLLEALEAHPEVRDNTVIVLISDHGFSMGEKLHWTKFTPWETEMRIPLVVWDPRRPGGERIKTQVTLLDIFPSLLDFAGVEHPVFPDGSAYLDGKSFVDQLDGAASLDRTSLMSLQIPDASSDAFCYTQYSLRDESFHYLRFRTNGTPACTPGTDSIINVVYELGESRNIDPHEWTDISSSPIADVVVDGLANYLPGGPLFGKTDVAVEIAFDSLACRPTPGSLIRLNAVPSGPVPLATYQWSISGTPVDTGMGLHVATPAGMDRMIVRLDMKDSVGSLIAIDQLVIDLAEPSPGSARFYADKVTGSTYDLVDFDPGAGISEIEWDYGDGFVIRQREPYRHTYTHPGSYTISANLFYGNDESNLCLLSYDTTITVVPADMSTACEPVQNSWSTSGAGSAKLQWSPVYNATRYKVGIKKTADIDALFSSNITEVAHNRISGLDPNTDYTWRVKTICDLDTSAWSYHFRTVTARCGKPMGITFTKLAPNKVLFTWDQMEFANLGNRFTLRKSGSVVLDTVLALGSSSLIIDGLNRGMYQYGIRSLCNEVVPFGAYFGDWVEGQFTINWKFPPKEEYPGALALRLSVSPNPTSGFVEIGWESEFQGVPIQIINAMGTTVAETIMNEVQGVWQLDLSQLPAGIYFAVTPGFLCRPQVIMVH